MPLTRILPPYWKMTQHNWKFTCLLWPVDILYFDLLLTCIAQAYHQLLCDPPSSMQPKCHWQLINLWLSLLNMIKKTIKMYLICIWIACYFGHNPVTVKHFVLNPSIEINGTCINFLLMYSQKEVPWCTMNFSLRCVHRTVALKVLSFTWIVSNKCHISSNK